jgi:hypothetical protein
VLTAAMIAELKDIERLHGGWLPTERVVEKARDPASALHQHPRFIWNESEAAHRYLLDAARDVIQVYVTVIDRGDGDRRSMRAYCTVVDASDGERAYRPTATVLRENRAVIINSVLDRIVSHIRAYPLPEFDELLILVDQIRAAATTPRRSSRGRRRGGGEARPRPSA